MTTNLMIPFPVTSPLKVVISWATKEKQLLLLGSLDIHVANIIRVVINSVETHTNVQNLIMKLCLTLIFTMKV